MSDTRARELGITPLARIVVHRPVRRCRPRSWASARSRPSRQALARAGMTIDDIDLVEINEAFAAQVIPSAPRARHRLGQAERQRRRDRRRPPVRHDRRPHHHHPDQLACSGTTSSSAWRPCASAAARAWPWSSSASPDPLPPPVTVISLYGDHTHESWKETHQPRPDRSLSTIHAYAPARAGAPARRGDRLGATRGNPPYPWNTVTLHGGHLVRTRRGTRHLRATVTMAAPWSTVGARVRQCTIGRTSGPARRRANAHNGRTPAADGRPDAHSGRWIRRWAAPDRGAAHLGRARRQDTAGGMPLSGGVAAASVYSLTGAVRVVGLYAGPK